MSWGEPETEEIFSTLNALLNRPTEQELDAMWRRDTLHVETIAQQREARMERHLGR